MLDIHPTDDASNVSSEPDNLIHLDEYIPEEPDWLTEQREYNSSSEISARPHNNSDRRREAKKKDTGKADGKPNKFRVMRMSEVMALAPQEWLLDGFIYEDSIVFVFGEPGSAKSFLTFNWFAHLAIGKDWLGYKVYRSGLMIYTAAEGVRGYQRRARALESHRGIALESLEDNLRWITTAVQLDSEGSVIEYIKAINEEKGDRPLLGLCIDTLFQCAGGVDINKPGDASKLMNVVKFIKDETKASFVVVVHHSGKQQTNGAMGSMAFKASCDLMYEVKKEEITNLITVKSHKVKDDEAIEKTFVLKKVVYGDGPRDHSCVIVSSESEIEEVKKSFNALPLQQQKVLDALGDNQYRDTEWSRLCEMQGIKRSSFRFAKDALVEKNLVHKVEPDKSTSPYRKGPAPASMSVAHRELYEIDTLGTQLAEKHIALTINADGKLQCQAPKGAITPDILTALKKHRAAIIERLRQSAAAQPTPELEIPDLSALDEMSFHEDTDESATVYPAKPPMHRERPAKKRIVRESSTPPPPESELSELDAKTKPRRKVRAFSQAELKTIHVQYERKPSVVRKPRNVSKTEE